MGGTHPVVPAVVGEAVVEGDLVGGTERVVLADDGRVRRHLRDGKGSDGSEGGGELHCCLVCGGRRAM